MGSTPCTVGASPLFALGDDKKQERKRGKEGEKEERGDKGRGMEKGRNSARKD